MERLRSCWLVVTALVLGLAWLAPVGDSHAQSSGTEATVQALQTEAADLKTMINLQTEVAGLQAQLTPGNQSAATPNASSGTLLYQAEWSQGLDAWSATPNWQITDDMLINDGQNGDNTVWLHAPPLKNNIADYAVEAEIQFVRDIGWDGPMFGIVTRGGSNGGYIAGVATRDGESFIGSHSFSVGDIFYLNEALSVKQRIVDNKWHTYRFEVKGNMLRFLIDGQMVFEIMDNQRLSGSEFGLFDFYAQINVRAFKVIAL